ncbi:MAG: hypothetical protein V1755_14820, partial [Chloroflexota bacterium]
MTTKGKAPVGTHDSDVGVRRKEYDALWREALEYGIVLFTERLEEARQIVENLRLDRLGKPPCYKRSFLGTDPRCRVCELRWVCADITPPEQVPPDQLEPVPCRVCGLGTLSAEKLHPLTEKISDFTCTTPGCSGSLVAQTQWAPPLVEAPGKILVSEVIKPPKPQRSLVDIEDAVIGFLKMQANRTATKIEIVRALPDKPDKITKALQQLVEEKVLEATR